MSYATYLPSSYQEDKIAINGVALLNRHELSTTQDKELQRFIDNNQHIIQWQDREPIIVKPPRRTPNHHYEEARRSLSRGPSPFEGSFNSIDRLAQKKEKQVEEYPTISSSDLPICPNIDGHNYTDEFPGLEYLSDNTYIEQLIKAGQVKIGASGLISNPGSRASSAMGGTYSHPNYPVNPINPAANSGITTPVPQPHHQTSDYYSSDHSTTTYPSYGSTSQYRTSSTYGSIGNVGGSHSNYSTLRGSIKNATLPPTSPYSSLKRKGVSWLDQERARSLSPAMHQSQYRHAHHYARPASTIHTTTYTTTY